MNKVRYDIKYKKNFQFNISNKNYNKIKEVFKKFIIKPFIINTILLKVNILNKKCMISLYV